MSEGMPYDTTKRAKESFRDEALAIDGVHGIGVRPEIVDGEKTGRFVIVVHLEPGASESPIPDFYDSVPIRIEHDERPTLSEGIVRSPRQTTYPSVVGGSEMSGGEEGGTGTLGMAVEDNDGDSYILTNRHITSMQEEPVSDIIGRRCYQPGHSIADREIGTVEEVSWWTDEEGTSDSALVTPDEGIPLTDQALSLGTIGEPESPEFDTVYLKSGRTTSLTSTQIVEMDASLSISVTIETARVVTFHGCILLDYVATGGDSGSVYFRYDEEDEVSHPMALHFAGGEYGIAIPWAAVESEHDTPLEPVSDPGPMEEVETYRQTDGAPLTFETNSLGQIECLTTLYGEPDELDPLWIGLREYDDGDEGDIITRTGVYGEWGEPHTTYIDVYDEIGPGTHQLFIERPLIRSEQSWGRFTQTQDYEIEIDSEVSGTYTEVEIVDNDGNPREGIYIEIAELDRVLYTHDDGTVGFRSFYNEGDTLTVEVIDDDLHIQDGFIEAGETDQSVTVYDDFGFTTIQVRTDAGAGIEGVEVEIPFLDETRETNWLGQVIFGAPGVDGEQVDVYFEHPAYRYSQSELTLGANVEFILQPYGIGIDPIDYVNLGTTETGSDGEAVFEGWGTGEYLLNIDEDGYRSKIVDFFHPAQSDLSFALQEEDSYDLIPSITDTGPYAQSGYGTETGYGTVTPSAVEDIDINTTSFDITPSREGIDFEEFVDVSTQLAQVVTPEGLAYNDGLLYTGERGAPATIREWNEIGDPSGEEYTLPDETAGHTNAMQWYDGHLWVSCSENRRTYIIDWDGENSEVVDTFEYFEPVHESSWRFIIEDEFGNPKLIFPQYRGNEVWVVDAQGAREDGNTGQHVDLELNAGYWHNPQTMWKGEERGEWYTTTHDHVIKHSLPDFDDWDEHTALYSDNIQYVHPFPGNATLEQIVQADDGTFYLLDRAGGGYIYEGEEETGDNWDNGDFGDWGVDEMDGHHARLVDEDGSAFIPFNDGPTIGVVETWFHDDMGDSGVSKNISVGVEDMTGDAVYLGTRTDEDWGEGSYGFWDGSWSRTGINRAEGWVGFRWIAEGGRIEAEVSTDGGWTWELVGVAGMDDGDDGDEGEEDTEYSGEFRGIRIERESGQALVGPWDIEVSRERESGT